MILTVKFFLNKNPQRRYINYLVQVYKIRPLIAKALTNCKLGSTITVVEQKWYQNIFSPGKLITFNATGEKYKVSTKEYRVIKRHTDTVYQQVSPILDQLEKEEKALLKKQEGVQNIINIMETNKSTS